MHPIIPISALDTLSDTDLLVLYAALARILDDPTMAECDRANIVISMCNIATVMAQRHLPPPSPQV